MKEIQRIAASERVGEALTAFEEGIAEAIDLAIAVQQIPSPTFFEVERAKFVQNCFTELGIADVYRDEMNNVFARRPGVAKASPVIISAHSDTVFPANTDLSVRFENGRKKKGRIFAPGLADNALGVAGLVLLARTLDRFELRTQSDIWLVANVGEEGLGNLQGMRTVVEKFPEARAYLVVEGGSFGHVFHEAIAVRRFRLEVRTPGGHSWGDFGSPSAVHVLGDLISKISNLPVPPEPKTTYNFGVVEGGTSVNSIAATATGLLDIRSVDPGELDSVVAAVQELVVEAASQSDVEIDLTQIGDRPAGQLPRDAEPVVWAADALRQVGWKNVIFMGGSTDANIPLSMGLPAVCIGLAKSGNTHRLDEYLDPTHLPKGLGQLLLLALAAAGFETDSRR